MIKVQKNLAVPFMLLIGVVTISAAPQPSSAEPTSVKVEVNSQNADDEKILRSQAADYAKFYAAGDAKSLANMWSDDGTFVLPNGKELQGKSAIEKFFVEGFKESGAQPLDINIESVRFPAKNLAIEEGNSSLKSGSSMPLTTHYSVVHVKGNDGWKMVQVSESIGRAVSNETLQDLGWLIGSWTAKNGDDVIHFKADWAGEHKFIHCEFVRNTTPAISEIELIGWNPHLERIVSWHFDAKGGFGEGRWAKRGQSWYEDAAGMEGNGTVGNSTYILRKIDDNSFGWRATDRSLAGQRLPDMQELTVRRDK